MTQGVDESRRRAADRWRHAATAHCRMEGLRTRSRWLLDSSRAILQRPNGLIRGAADPDAFGPTLSLGQAVRHLHRSEIGIVIGLLFSDAELALVRWTTESTFELVAELLEVRISTV